MIITSAQYTDPPDASGNSYVCKAVIDGNEWQGIDLRVHTFHSEQLLAWIAAGNTPTPTPAPSPAQQAQAQYNAAIAAGLTVNWTTSTTLNGLYSLDDTARFNITAETVAILTNAVFTNGIASKNWPDTSNVFHSFNVSQFKAFATAVAKYVDDLASALSTASAGQTATWPSATVTINL